MIPTIINRSKSQQENHLKTLTSFITENKLLSAEASSQEILQNLYKAEDLFLSATRYLSYAFVLHQRKVLKHKDSEAFWFRVHRNHLHIGTLYLCGLFDEKAYDHGSLSKLITLINQLDSSSNFPELSQNEQIGLKRLRGLRNKWLAHYSFDKEKGKWKWEDLILLLNFAEKSLYVFYEKYLQTDNVTFDSNFFLEECSYAIEELADIFELDHKKQQQLIKIVKSELDKI